MDNQEEILEKYKFNLTDEVPEEGLEDFQAEFLTDRSDDLKDIKTSLTNHDLTSIAKTVHKWKGYSEPYGFHFLASTARKIEDFVSKNEINEIKEILYAIEVYLTQKQKVI